MKGVLWRGQMHRFLGSGQRGVGHLKEILSSFPVEETELVCVALECHHNASKKRCLPLFFSLIPSLQTRVIPVPVAQGCDSGEPCERGCERSALRGRQANVLAAAP